jgi:hypothetical protein
MKHKIFLLIITISIFSRLSAQKQQLFLLAGQSNAVGQGDSSQSAICLPGTAYEYKAISNECTSLKDPVGEKWELFQKAGSGSVAPAFAKRLNELTGFKINIVAAARGGASCNVLRWEITAPGMKRVKTPCLLMR